MFGLKYYYFMPLGFALICFAFCVCFLSFSWRILPQTEFLRSPHSIPSVTLGHSQLTTREIIAMCKAAKTVKTVFYVTKIKLKQLLSWHNASDQPSWTLSEDEINCVGSDQFINIKSNSKLNCQNDFLQDNMTGVDKKSYNLLSDFRHNPLIMSSVIDWKAFILSACFQCLPGPLLMIKMGMTK